MSNNGQPLPSQPLELLAHEQTQATAAMRSTLDDLWAHVPTTQHLIHWAGEHPLWAAGAAAGLGAMTGALVTPSSRPAAPQEPASAPARGGIVSSLFSQALPMLGMAISEAARSMLLTSLIPADKAGGEQAEAAPQENLAGDGI